MPRAISFALFSLRSGGAGKERKPAPPLWGIPQMWLREGGMDLEDHNFLIIETGGQRCRA
jgi:hypothetical protein